jgi:hypothetical protein
MKRPDLLLDLLDLLDLLAVVTQTILKRYSSFEYEPPFYRCFSHIVATVRNGLQTSSDDAKTPCIPVFFLDLSRFKKSHLGPEGRRFKSCRPDF